MGFILTRLADDVDPPLLWLWAACAWRGLFPAAAIPTQLCDPSYECQFTYVDKFGSSWTYDLSTLCNPQGNYQVRGGS